MAVLRNQADWLVAALLVLACSVCAAPLLFGVAAVGFGAAIGWLATVPPVVLTVVCLAPLAFVPVRRALRHAGRAQPKRE